VSESTDKVSSSSIKSNSPTASLDYLGENIYDGTALLSGLLRTNAVFLLVGFRMIQWPENETFNNRILICDDNKAIHKDFQKVLSASNRSAHVSNIEDQLFEDDPEYHSDQDIPNVAFTIESAYQGQDALRMAEAAAAAGAPYAVIFMDVRMPPGWDGILTAEKIWEKLPQTEIVIVTAYSDYTWEEMIGKLGINNKLLFIKKPFDSLSVKQLALNLTNKWNNASIARKQFEEMQNEMTRRMKSLENSIRDM